MQHRWFLIQAVVSAVSAPVLRALQHSAAPCARYEAAVRANPNDLAAAVSLGHCTTSDEEMIAPGGDSARLAFRTSWTPALRALRYAVAVDPSYSRAYRPLFFMLFAETRDGCSRATGMCLHVASVIRDGDSLITVPRRVPEHMSDMSPYDDAVRETISRQGPSLNEARALAERWASVAPNDYRPLEYHGRALLRLQDFGAAADVLEHAALLGTPESRRRLFWERFEALVKSNRGADARRVLDEAAADPGRDTTQLSRFTIAGLNTLLGRYRPPPVDSVRARQARARLDSVLRNSPPPPPREPTFEELIAAGDTAGARRALARIDSMMALPPGTMRFPRYELNHLYIAQSYLALRDTARAEAMLADIERPFHERPFQFRISFAYDDRPWVGRAWLLSGDLAAARGRLEDAVRMYRCVVGLWGGGDADLQPVVDEARVMLDSLSRR